MPKHFDAPGGGPSQRQLRVGEQVRRVLSETLMRGDLHDTDLSRMSITVTEVRTSPDLRHATAFILPLGGKKVGTALEALRRNAGELSRRIAKELRMKYSPRLNFLMDESFDNADATRRVFDDERVRRDLDSDADDSAREDDR